MKKKYVAQILAMVAVSGTLNHKSFAQVLTPQPRLGNLPGELLVQFNSNVTDAQIADAFQQGALNLIKHVQTPAMKGAGRLGLTRVATKMPLDVALAVLNKLPGIDFAELHGIGSPDFVANDPYYLDGSLWGAYSNDLPFPIGPQVTSNTFGSQAEKIWDAGFVGSSDVYVGIIDTGFQPDHPDLSANVWTNSGEISGNGIDDDANGYVDDLHGWNAVDGNGNVFDAASGSHATHVAGTIGAVGGNGIGVAGINWNVKLISGRCVGPNGVTVLDAVEAIDYMTTLKISKGLNIVAINNSYSGGGISLALQDSLARAAQAGILAVCSASNQGSNNDASPRWPASLDTTAAAGFDSVVCVAAINAAGGKPDFSNFGSFSVDLGAPGADILSTVPDGAYSLGSGTSMATPHVTGALALFASINPGVSPRDLKTRLLTVGVVNTPSLGGITLTEGRLDVYSLATAAPSSTTVPAAPSGLTVTLAKAPAKGVANLSWTDRSANEKGFVIERKTSSTPDWQTIATLGPNTKSYSNNSLVSRTTYVYRVRAFNVAGSSSYSNEASLTVK